MTYAAVLARLVAARRFGVRLGLERMRELLDRLGAPERRLGTVIHVGGTNGKGSTVAMIAALAASRGRRVATYTSPHLSTLRERITLDGAMVTEAALVAAAARVSAADGDELTFFEQITAIAMLLIADAQVDVTVLEVGLGGRLDATNVVDAPIAVVTGIAMDHEAILGDTLEAIAIEKAGIWKPGRIAVIGCSGDPAAVPVLEARAREVGAKLVLVSALDVMQTPPINLIGEHQRRNAATALAAVTAANIDFDPGALTTLVHPGRFESAGDLIFDGAHNPDGARYLAATLATEKIRPVLVLAISADKDARAIVTALAPSVSAIIVTRYHQDRALDPETLAAICRDHIATVETAPDVVTAVTRARALGSPILIAGSLFIVGEARSHFLNAPTDPILVSDPFSKGTVSL